MPNAKMPTYRASLEFKNAKQMSDFLSGILPFQVSIEDNHKVVKRRRRRTSPPPQGSPRPTV